MCACDRYAPMYFEQEMVWLIEEKTCVGAVIINHMEFESNRLGVLDSSLMCPEKRVWLIWRISIRLYNATSSMHNINANRTPVQHFTCHSDTVF